MGRTAPGVAHGTVYRYIPEIVAVDGDTIWKNREDPDPISVMLRTPTGKQKREIIQAGRKDTVMINDKGIRTLNVENDENAMNEAAIAACMISIENYSSAGGVVCETAQDLILHGENAVVVDIGTEVRTSWSIEEKEARVKKSEGLSDSTPQETEASISTAESAKSEAITLTETATAMVLDSNPSPSSEEASAAAPSPG